MNVQDPRSSKAERVSDVRPRLSWMETMGGEASSLLNTTGEEDEPRSLSASHCQGNLTCLPGWASASQEESVHLLCAHRIIGHADGDDSSTACGMSSHSMPVTLTENQG